MFTAKHEDWSPKPQQKLGCSLLTQEAEPGLFRVSRLVGVVGIVEILAQKETLAQV